MLVPLFKTLYCPGKKFLSTSTALSVPMELRKIVSKLEELAPLNRAQDWDNVGLLVEPSPSCLSKVERVFLTNDLTEEVLDEAVSLPGRKVGLIIAYHPPIFRPLKRLTQATAKERIIVRAIESNIAVYSPHTAHDSVEGGVNDWLVSGLGEGQVTGVQVERLSGKFTNVVTVRGVQNEHTAEDLVEAAAQCLNGALDSHTTPSPGELVTLDLIISCRESGLPLLLPLIRERLPQSTLFISNSPKVPALGGGRLLTLTIPTPLSSLIERVKHHLSLPHIRIATPPLRTHGNDPPISTIAVCAGSGASVLRGAKADLFLTGEMSHHDVLEATSCGTAVILCEHSNTERGYLRVFAEKLEEGLGEGVQISVSEIDGDPLRIV